MAFDWMQVSVPEGASGRGQRMLRKTITDRAGLLRRLRFSQEAAVARIQANLRWEFDEDIASTPLPSVYNEIEAIVAEIYGN